MSYPFRKCSICDCKIRKKERICAKCTEQWKDELDSEWLQKLIEINNADFNFQLRNYSRTIPLDWIESRY